MSSTKHNLKANVRRSHSSPSSVFRYRNQQISNDDDYSHHNYNRNRNQSSSSNIVKPCHVSSSYHHHQHCPIYEFDGFHRTTTIQWILYPLYLFIRYFRLIFMRIFTNVLWSYCGLACDIRAVAALNRCLNIIQTRNDTSEDTCDNCQTLIRSNSSEDNRQHYHCYCCAVATSSIVTHSNSKNKTGNLLTSKVLLSSLSTDRQCSIGQPSQPPRRRSISLDLQQNLHHYGRSTQDSIDLFNALNLPTPSVVNIFLKPMFNALLDLTHISALLNLMSKMKKRIYHTIRWCPTSQQELDEAESKVLSYLKCNYKTYYVDIGSRWDLDHVRIWTIEIDPYPIMSGIGGKQEAKPDILYHEPSKIPPGLPLVMIHGFAAGIGLWALNLDEFARRGNRKIYAFDLLGFAKSSRPKFSIPQFKDLSNIQRIKAEATLMEGFMVDSIEKWRKAIGEPLQGKFILLGHSFGAYLSLAYALRHPSHVAHIILADAWGIPPENMSNHISNSGHINTRQLPWWVRFTVKLFLEILNPLSVLRALGPWGPGMLQAVRADIKRKFEPLTNNGQLSKRLSAAEKADHPPPLESGDDLSGDELSIDIVQNNKSKKDMNKCDFLNYIYHCNAQSKPSGEIAFKTLCTSNGWARLPMLERIHDLDLNITLTFIYGSRSWIDRQSGLQAKYILATKTRSAINNPSDYSDTDEEVERVEVHVLQGAGHHVYADKPKEFNELILSICKNIDYGYFGLDEDDDNNNNDNFIANSGTTGTIYHQKYAAQLSSGEYSSPSNTSPEQQSSSEEQKSKNKTSRPGRKYGNYLLPARFQHDKPSE